MPIHDWTQAPAGYFHHFHQMWVASICNALNAGRLPAGVFALVEQHAGGLVPDVLALEFPAPGERDDGFETRGGGGVALASDPPKTRFVSKASVETVYAAKANRVAVYREDEIIAVIEVMSPGNKSAAAALRQFVDKSLELLNRGVHLLVVDLFPPTSRDPNGIHGAIWGQLSDERFELPNAKPLTLAAYVAGVTKTAYVDPVAVGDALTEMPVFLDEKTYARTPLEETYATTWNACPKEFRDRVTAGR
jgi:hypothetical protein